jgi:endoglucanase
MRLLLSLILLISSSGLFAQSFQVQYKCGAANPSTQSIAPAFIILNNSGTQVLASELKLRYFYTKEGTSGEQFVCDFANIGVANVSAIFQPGYIEISFAPSSGAIPQNGSLGEVQFRFNKADWSSYDQSNDYSFDPMKINFAAWDRIALYRNGNLVWGIPYPAIGGTAGPTAVHTAAPTAGVTPVTGPTAFPTQPIAAAPSPIPNSANDDFLHTAGNNIVDKNGMVVRLTGINWFGYNSETHAFDGLWSCDLKNSLTQIAQRGFNVLRIPIATELLYNWSIGIYPAPNVTTSYINTYLAGKNSLQIFEIVLAQLKALGMKAIIDVHSVMSNAQDYQNPFWWGNQFTAETFFSTWEWLAARYSSDDTIIGCDLKNEPHGKPWDAGGQVAKWDLSSDPSNWKHAAETAATRILAKNPNLLIFVEGIETFPKDGVTWTSASQSDYTTSWWGGNLKGVATMPISLGTNQSRLVYSPHEYGPNVYVQTWFYPGFNETTLFNDCWYPNWYYIVENGTAPVFIGEWGGKLDGTDNETWLNAFRSFVLKKNLHFTFWCFNANSTDTGGLVIGDWVTWDEQKYAFVKPTLWKDSMGKFVGLDHTLPLGSSATGTTIANYYSAANPAPSADLPSSPSPIPVQTPTPNTTQASTPFPTPSNNMGDVNNDGWINIVDALLTAQFYVGIPVVNFDPTRADVNEDGRIDIVDALLIAQFYVGIIDSF